MVIVILWIIIIVKLEINALHGTTMVLGEFLETTVAKSLSVAIEHLFKGDLSESGGRLHHRAYGRRVADGVGVATATIAEVGMLGFDTSVPDMKVKRGPAWVLSGGLGSLEDSSRCCSYALARLMDVWR